MNISGIFLRIMRLSDSDISLAAADIAVNKQRLVFVNHERLLDLSATGTTGAGYYIVGTTWPHISCKTN